MKTNRFTLSTLSLRRPVTPAVFAAVFAAVLFAQSASATPKLVKALQLQQNHVYLGRVRVLLTPQALRLDCLGKIHFTVISRSPNWQVTAFRTDDRISFTQSFSEFCDQGLYSNIVMPQRPNKMIPGGSMFVQKVSGFPVQQIRLRNSMSKYMKHANFANPQTSDFFHSAYRVPTEGYMPIEYEVMMMGKDWMTNLSDQGQRRVVLETEKISLDNVPATEFEIPRGLTQVKSMTRVVIGSTKKMEQTGVDDLFKN